MHNFTWPVLLVAAFGALGAMPKGEAKVSVFESLRHERLTVTESSGNSTSTETRTASAGKMTFHAEVPLSVGPNFAPETFVTLQVGNFNCSVPLKDDPKYKVGRHEARISLREGKPDQAVRTVNGTVNLKWDAKTLTVDVESKQSLAAEQYVDETPGETKGEITGSVEFASQKVEFVLPFTAKVKRKNAASGNAQGSVVTIDLKGRL